MPPEVLGLIAVAAIAHATWNIQLKRAGASGTGFLWLTFAVGSVVFLPFGVWSLVQSQVDPVKWLGLAAISGALQVAYFFLLQAAYRRAEVSVVYPVARGSGPLIAVILALVILQERPGALALVGVGAVIVGVVVTGLAGRRVGSPLELPGILYGLAVGCLIALYTFWDGAAVTAGGMPAVALYWGSLLFQFAFVAPFALRDRTKLLGTLRRHGPAIFGVGVLSPIAYILVLFAIQLAPISLVAPAREVSVVLVSLAAWLFLGEANPARRLLGAGIVLVGIGLIALG